MPLIDTGPNSYQPVPYWSRNQQAWQTQTNNDAARLTPRMVGTTQSAARPAPAAPALPARPQLSQAQRMANANRVAAGLQGRPITTPQALSAPPAASQPGIAEQYQKALNKANRANERRYQDILGGYDDMTKKAMRRANVAANQQYREESARVSNDLTSRGLANSSLKGREHFDAYERSQRIPLEVGLQTGQNRLNFMERRNDVGPDLNQLLQLSQMQGQNEAQSDTTLDDAVSQIGRLIDSRLGAANSPNAAPTQPINIPTRNLGVTGFSMGNSGYQLPYMGGFQGPAMYSGGGGRRPPSAGQLQAIANMRAAEEDRRSRYRNLIDLRQGKRAGATPDPNSFPLMNQQEHEAAFPRPYTEAEYQNFWNFLNRP